MTKFQNINLFLFAFLVVLVIIFVSAAIMSSKKNRLDMNEIIDNLYLGSLHAGSNGKELQNQGITRVINLSYVSYPKYEGITYKTINVYDNQSADIAVYFDECVAFIDDALSRGEKVLVHCFAGISRSTSIVLAYLIEKYNHSLPDALRIVQEKRPVARPNEGFMLQLDAYSKNKTKINPA